MSMSLLANDSAATLHRLVEERSGILAKNTQSISEVEQEVERLREKLEKSNSTIFASLTSPEGDKLSQEQIAEMLRKLTSVMTIDVPKLTTDLEIIRENKLVLRELVQKMRDLKSRCEAALQRLENVTTLDEKSIQNLTVLRVKAVQAGLPQTCQDGSVLL